MQLIEKAVVPNGDCFDVPFVRRSQMVQTLHDATGWSESSIDRVLAGFSLTRTTMENEGRLIFKPRQEYRAIRRAFFEMPHESGPHLMWSRGMARECLFELMKGTLFQRCPLEWKSPDVNKAFAKLQNSAGSWFESQVDHSVSGLGAIGRPSLKDGIGQGADRVAIPSGIGEIDYLGFFPAEELLVVFEDKMVDGGFEPMYFRSDISNFITGKKPYVEQLRRKTEWVQENLGDVCKGLSSLLPDHPAISPRKVAGAIVTLHPTYASYLISDFPCVSLTELMIAHGKNNAWPYAAGVFDVS